MISDSYVLWKISDPLKFAQTLNSSVESGESRINTAVYNATKNAISSMSQDQVITSRDGELSDMVMEDEVVLPLLIVPDEEVLPVGLGVRQVYCRHLLHVVHRGVFGDLVPDASLCQKLIHGHGFRRTSRQP